MFTRHCKDKAAFPGATYLHTRPGNLGTGTFELLGDCIYLISATATSEGPTLVKGAGGETGDGG
eukprot:740457-Pelagomonas_calceolata.AAC.1